MEIGNKIKLVTIIQQVEISNWMYFSVRSISPRVLSCLRRLELANFVNSALSRMAQCLGANCCRVFRPVSTPLRHISARSLRQFVSGLLRGLSQDDLTLPRDSRLIKLVNRYFRPCSKASPNKIGCLRRIYKVTGNFEIFWKMYVVLTWEEIHTRLS